KLYATQMIAIKQRFAYILKSIEAARLEARVEALRSGRGEGDVLALEAEFDRRRAEAERARDAVLSANEPTVVEEDSFRTVMNLPARTFERFEDFRDFRVEDWAEGPSLTAEEIDALSIRKGSLSTVERKAIEGHVQKTYEFLEKMPWTSELRRIPEIAWAHHEKLDGSGYPRGLRGRDGIPVESRMMTIADIYDALVAWDRPYKKSVSVERALGILDEEARAGKLDAELLKVFVEARIFDLPEFKARLQRKA
ncbi:MAG TPA: HD domain-containing phosphohydrolase, partial [Vicinamibacteria bacterium]